MATPTRPAGPGDEPAGPASAPVPGPVPRPERRGMVALLRQGEFARFFWAATISNGGSWMQMLSIPYAVYEVTGSRTWLGTTALLGQLPTLVGNTLAGSVADRVSRKRLLLVTQSILTVLALTLWALWSTGHHSLTTLLVLVFVTGFVGGFNTPIWQSFIPLLVERDRLADAIRINSLQFSAARVLGPVAAGFVLARSGPGAAFLANALSYLPVLAVIATLHPRAVPTKAREKLSTEIRAGWSYLFDHPSLLLATATISLVAFFGWSQAQLLPAIARDHFHEPADRIGWLSGSYGIGMVVGVALAASFSTRVRRSTLARLAMWCWLVGLGIVAGVHHLGLGLVGFFVMGFAHVMVGQSAQVTIQVQVDEAYRGRVIATYFQGLFVGSPLGAFFLGYSADWFGIGPALLLNAAGLGALLAVVMLRFGGFRTFDADHPILGRRAVRRAEARGEPLAGG